MKRTALKPSTKPMKRTRLKPMSDEKRAQIPARIACVNAVIARDGGCVFERRYTEFGGRTGIVINVDLRCNGRETAHEPGKRSHGAQPTNPDECQCLCFFHHRWVHDHPDDAEDLGLLVGKKTRSHVKKEASDA